MQFKLSTPQGLALLLALSITGVSFVFFITIVLVPREIAWSIIIFSALFLFIFNYVLLFFVLKKFIITKLRPIYNTIESLKQNEKDHFEELDNTDIISEVNEEVVKWAKRKTKEISILKSNEKYRKEFLGNVSHELKTPLFNIQGYISTLLDGGLHDDKINELYLERTERNLNRLITIVKDLEAISKLESGELKLNITNFNIYGIIDEVFELHEMRAKERGITLKLHKKPKNPLYVVADKARIFEVVSNLVLNSIIYGNQNGTTIVSLHDIEPKILIEVADNGIGIASSDLKRIFERFYRVDKSRSTQLGGTGLGLAIVKHVMEAHGELISVKSKLAEGTTFSLTLKKLE